MKTPMKKILTALAVAIGLATAQAAETPRTISINFDSATGAVTGEYGIVPSSNWNNFSGATQATAVDVTVSDGTTGVTAMWWSKNTWYWTGATDDALKGYLDDGACGDGKTSDGPHICVKDIPFACYDVIVYYATDTGSAQFNPAAFKEWTVQTECGSQAYSYDGSATAPRNDASLKFGASQQKTAIVGKNVSYLKKNFTWKDLDIKGGARANSARGGIAAIQIVEVLKPTYTGVVSMNFGSNQQSVAAGTDPGGLVPDTDWTNIPNASGTDVTSGSYSVTFDAAGTYVNGNAQQHLKGYLDENKGGSPYPINITVKNVAAKPHDVYIYCESDNASGWSYKTVNGANYYAGADGKAVAGTSAWGAASTVSALGKNVMLVEDVYPDADGNITVKSERNDSKRGCIAALQICQKEVPPTYSATINQNANWEDIEWDPSKPAEGFEDNAVLKLTVDGNRTLTFNGVLDAPQRLEISNDDDTSLTLKVADALFTDGCWEKAVSFGSFAPGCATVPETLPGDFTGAYALTANGFKVRAQNREVISINIGGGRNGGAGMDADEKYLVPSNETYYGLAPVKGETWNNINRKWQTTDLTEVTLVGSIAAAEDGSIVARPTIDLSAKAKETYSWDCNQPYLSGYLDDGKGVTVSVHGVPYTKYDVIVYATSDESYIRLAPITVNGTKYTFKDGETVVDEGTTSWGVGQCKDPAFGKNALYIKDLSGEELSIVAKRDGNNGRGTVCAVQVICQGDIEIRHEYVGEMSGDVTWTNGRDDENLFPLGDPWENGSLNTITITNTAENATFAFAAETYGQQVKFVSAEGCALTIDATSIADFSQFGIFDFTEAAGGVTILLPEESEFDPSTLPTTIKGNWKFSSTGTLVFDGEYPDAKYKTFFTNEVDWVGTVWLKNVAVAGQVFNDYGNTNSTLRFTGVRGWFNYNTYETTLPIELVDGDDVLALEVTDGSLNRKYVFAKVTGEGSINVSSVHADPFIVQIKDVSEFTGKISSLDSTTPFGDETKAFPIFIGETEGALPYGSASMIGFADGATVNGAATFEAETVAAGATLNIPDASVGATVVAGVTADPILGTEVICADSGEETVCCLAYSEGDQAVVIAQAVAFTVADCANATFAVAGAFLKDEQYWAADGATVRVTYTADDGYLFASTMSATLVVEAYVESGMEPISASEEPVAEAPFVYDGGWTWNGEEVSDETVSNNTAVAVVVKSDLAWPIDRDGITVESGILTVESVSKRAAAVTVGEDGVLDLNGNNAKEMALTLDGGKVTYGETKKLDEADQIKVLALTADSEISTPVKGQIYAAGYATKTTIALGDGYTLTKTGTNQLQIVNVDVTGTGVVYVAEGELYGSEDTRVGADVAFKVAEGATLRNRSGKTMNPAKIVGVGGTLNNEGTMPGFELSGSLAIANHGSFGTITNASGAVVDIGQKRGLVFAGAGTVNVTLTDAEYEAGQATLFTLGEGATTAIGDVTYNGEDITSKCTIEGGSITAIQKAPPVPEWMEGAGEENVELYNAWAATYSVTDPTTAKKDAFLLNVANDDEAIEDAKKEFTLTISFDDEGKPVVECPNEDDYNGTVIIKGKAALTDDEWHAQAEGDQFFQATLELIPAN